MLETRSSSDPEIWSSANNYMCVYMYIYIYIYIYVLQYLSLSLPLYIYIYIYTHTCLYIYIHTHSTRLFCRPSRSTDRVTRLCWRVLLWYSSFTIIIISSSSIISSMSVYICIYIHTCVYMGGLSCRPLVLLDDAMFPKT